MKLLRKLVLLIVFLLAYLNSGLGQVKKWPSGISPTKALILWNESASRSDSVDQESFAAMAASMGFSALKIDSSNLMKTELSHPTLLLIPHASSRFLSGRQVTLILSELRKGLRLMTDGASPLSSGLGLRLGRAARVGVVVDKSFASNQLRWPDRPRVPWIAADFDSSANVLYADSSSGRALAISGSFGKGKYIFLSALLDDLSGRGYSRFPTLVHAIVRELGCEPPFQRRGIDAYFDPGYRFNIPIEDLASRWRLWGIRAVHAAAWYNNNSPPYDYRKLIDAAHRNGVLVYAWLEWPHVGQGFWNQHPEWRQKNALLQDAKLDWLYLMDLQNSDCMNAALSDLSRQLELDWDGVDIAEFTITGAGGEALQGPSRPDYFTSFGTPMRTEFSRVGGFDPLELENPNSAHFWKRDSVALEKFYEYRQTVNNRLLRQVVTFVDSLKDEGKRDWEMIHTIVDNTLHPEFDRLLGFDLKATLALLKEYDITLNVEDPYMEWQQPPERYRRLRQTLMTLIPDRSSMIDINVVPIHPLTQRGFASEQATGTEFLQQLQRASERKGRVCVYSESSVFEQDWQLVPHAMAGGSTIKKGIGAWEVNVPATVKLKWELKELSPVVDGKPWPCYGDSGIILPAGMHQLSFTKRNRPANAGRQSLRLVDMGGELIECQYKEAGIEIAYTSPARCLLTLDRPIAKVLVDGIPKSLPVFKGVEGYLIVAPSGKHRLDISE